MPDSIILSCRKRTALIYKLESDFNFDKSCLHRAQIALEQICNLFTDSTSAAAVCQNSDSAFFIDLHDMLSEFKRAFTEVAFDESSQEELTHEMVEVCKS